jgi:hypothetical protein
MASENKEPTLAELNRILFASMLPATSADPVAFSSEGFELTTDDKFALTNAVIANPVLDAPKSRKAKPAPAPADAQEQPATEE